MKKKQLSDSEELEVALRLLSGRIATMRWNDFSLNAQSATQRIFFDDIGAILAGSLEEELCALRAAWKDDRPARSATLLTRGFPRADVLRACLHNGTSGAGPEIAEGYRFATAHAGIYTLPVVLALGESEQASGSAVLTAMAAGYEAAACCSTAFRLPPHVHPHGPWGLVGASVAAAHLQGGDVNRIFSALTLALSLLPGAAWDVAMAGGSIRNAWTGFGALAGALVPSLANAGYTTPMIGLVQALRDVLQTEWEPERLARPLHEGLAVENNYHKRFSCVGFIPPVIEALQQALSGTAVDPTKVQSVVVEVPSAAERLSNQQPATAVAARFSVPYCVAVCLTTGTVAPASFTRAVLEDEVMRDLCRRVSVVQGDDLPHPYSAQRSARVHVTLADGTRHQGYCANARGDFSDPLSDAELTQKFIRMTAPIFGAQANAAASVTWDFVREKSVAEFIARLADCDRDRTR